MKNNDQIKKTTESGDAATPARLIRELHSLIHGMNHGEMLEMLAFAKSLAGRIQR